MKVVKTSSEIQKSISKYRANSIKIGFVPTMGALHAGHLSLIETSKSQNDITIGSIFVNPTQFNDPKDFQRYPRQEEVDLEKLASVGCDIVFMPQLADIYPQPDSTIYELGEISTLIEGAHRPGHFNGVASVVKRMFEIIQPDHAYFGLKDYQQYLIINTLVEKYDLGVKIVGCPIIRSKSGLALSSRNQLLSVEGKELAGNLSKALKVIAQNAPTEDAETLAQMGIDFLSDFPGINLEYLLVVDAETLKKPFSKKQDRIALIAACVEGVRLIDNMLLKHS